MDTDLLEITSDQPQVCPIAQIIDYDFSAPFSPLEVITGQASAQSRPQGEPPVQPDVIKNQPSFSQPPIGKNIYQAQESLPKASPFHQASKSSFLLGEYTPEKPPEASKESDNGHSSHASVQIVDGSDSVTDGKQEDEVAAILELKSKMGNLAHKIEANEDKANFIETSKEDDAVRQAEKDQKGQTTHSDCGGIESLAGTSQRSSDAQEKDENISLQKIHVKNVDLKAGELASDGLAPSQSIHGHSSDAQIKVGQFVSEVTTPLPSPSVHGHISDSHMTIEQHVSEVDAALPSHSAHGHSSDAHIKVGENVSEFVTSFLTPNIHGHASDAHIKVGEHVSDVVAPLPSASVYGHSSDSHIKIGENVSDVAAPLPFSSVHGHSSDANIKVGEFVSNIPEERPRWSKYGHASDCVLQTGCVVSGSEPTLSALPGSSYGHSSDSTLGIGCVVSGEEPKRSPLPGSVHGHSSDSNLGIGCVVSKPEPLPTPLPGSTYGHSSDSTLGVGCVVLGTMPQASVLPGSAYGHSSDSSLGVGCLVKEKNRGNKQQMEDNEGKGKE